jgi:high-affinity iron transporter
MFANYLIGLREGLEAALVVSILIAYVVRTGRRDRITPIGIGVAVAVAASVAFGALLTYTSTDILQTSRSRETFGGILSVVAVGFVTWMVFWMRRTARTMRSELSGSMQTAVELGIVAVAVTAFMAVAREGLETALFFWSAVQAAGSTLSPVLGFTLGLATAIVIAWLLYRRSVTLDLARFFTWTGAGLVVVAAGVLAYGVHDLQEGGVLGGLDSLAFDISAQVPPGSWYGTLLKGTINLSPRTTVLQAIVWVAYIVPVMYLFLRGSRTATARAGALAAVAALMVLLAGCGGGSAPEATAGKQTFSVRNTGSQVTEVYVYGTGDRVMGEALGLHPARSDGDLCIQARDDPPGRGTRRLHAMPPGTRPGGWSGERLFV